MAFEAYEIEESRLVYVSSPLPHSQKTPLLLRHSVERGKVRKTRVEVGFGHMGLEKTLENTLYEKLIEKAALINPKFPFSIGFCTSLTLIKCFTPDKEKLALKNPYLRFCMLSEKLFEFLTLQRIRSEYRNIRNRNLEQACHLAEQLHGVLCFQNDGHFLRIFSDSPYADPAALKLIDSLSDGLISAGTDLNAAELNRLLEHFPSVPIDTTPLGSLSLEQILAAKSGCFIAQLENYNGLMQVAIVHEAGKLKPRRYHLRSSSLPLLEKLPQHLKGRRLKKLPVLIDSLGIHMSEIDK